MVYQIIFKKRFKNKLEKLLNYIESEFGLFVNLHSTYRTSEAFMPVNIIGCIIELKATKLLFLNMYDTRINPKRNRLK